MLNKWWLRWAGEISFYTGKGLMKSTCLFTKTEWQRKPDFPFVDIDWIVWPGHVPQNSEDTCHFPYGPDFVPYHFFPGCHCTICNKSKHTLMNKPSQIEQHTWPTWAQWTPEPFFQWLEFCYGSPLSWRQ